MHLFYEKSRQRRKNCRRAVGAGKKEKENYGNNGTTLLLVGCLLLTDYTTAAHAKNQSIPFV